MKKKVCPECNSNLFYEDLIRQETSCRNCGLILLAPYSYGLIFPGYKIVPQKKKIHIRIKLYEQKCLIVSYNLK